MDATLVNPWLSTLHLQLLFWIGGYGFARCAGAESLDRVYTFYPRFVAYSALLSASLRYGQLPWYAYAVLYGPLSLAGAAFFNWDQRIPGCAWSIRKADCHKLRKNGCLLLGLALLVLLLVAVLGYSVYRAYFVEHWPVPDMVSLGAAWVAPPVMYGLWAWKGAPKPQYHVHHYALAFWLAFLLPFDTLEAHAVRAVACGVFAQGAFVAAMGPLLFPPAASSSSFFSNSTIRRSRRRTQSAFATKAQRV